MPPHPLQPLTSAEIQTCVDLLKAQALLTPTTRVISITLRDPGKQMVLSWPQGPALDRLAEAVLFHNDTNIALTVTLNLTRSEVVVARQAPAGSQPTLSVDEQVECEQAVMASPEFKAALEKQYGPTDTSLLMVDIWSAGYYGDPAESGRRLTRPLCFLRSAPGENGYAHPIEGIRPIVDLNTMTVIAVEEYGTWPLPPQAGNYSAESVKQFRTDIKPLIITQPDGPSFVMDGNQIHWQKWDVVIGFSAREGLTIHHVRYQDGSRQRSILYRASMTEMVVPYGDPSTTQYRKNAFDVGEYGMGMCANSLQLGCDCLGYIQYLDADLVDSRGRALTIPNAICIHEEDFGILWKHTDRRMPDKPEVRRSRRLVISSVSTVENYEYGFFWYFYQDGNIQFEIKLTGILSLGAVHEGEKPIYGAMIAPSLYAPNHQHFFNMRLDVAIDGIDNTIQQFDVVGDPVSEQNPHGNAFHAVATDLRTELQARANLDTSTGRTWKFTNPTVTNAVGNPVAYRFLPGDNAVPFASREAWWRKRASFVNHHVWVTPFHEDERFAAGDFPNQSQGGDGLEAWTAANRAIQNTDVVFWYTFGHTHIPRMEDYPVMPAAYIGFLLKPSGFFHENPGNDLPPAKAAASHASCTC